MGLPVGLRVAQLDLDGVAAQLALELVRAALGHDPAVVDDGQPAGQAVGLLQVVGGEQDGEPLRAGQVGDLGPHVGPDLRVEPGGGLVQEQHPRPVDQAHGDVEAPLHPAGVAAADPVGRLGQAEALQQLPHPAPQPGAAQAVHLPLEGEVLPPGGLQVDPGPLGDQADGPAHPLGAGQHVDAGHAGLAAVGAGQGGEDLDRGRLAGAVGAEQAEHGAGLDLEAEPVQGADVLGVGLGQVAGLDGRAGWRHWFAPRWSGGRSPVSLRVWRMRSNASSRMAAHSRTWASVSWTRRIARWVRSRNSARRPSKPSSRQSQRRWSSWRSRRDRFSWRCSRRISRAACLSSCLRSEHGAAHLVADLAGQAVHRAGDLGLQLVQLVLPAGQLLAAGVGDLVDLAAALLALGDQALGLQALEPRVDGARGGGVQAHEAVLQQPDHLVAVARALVQQLEQVQPQPSVAEHGTHKRSLGGAAQEGDVAGGAGGLEPAGAGAEPPPGRVPAGRALCAPAPRRRWPPGRWSTRA